MTVRNQAQDHRAAAYGLSWTADVPLDGFDPVPSLCCGDACNDRADVRVARVDRLAERGLARPVNRGGGRIYPDGARLDWRDEITFDMVDGNRIDYLPGPGWQGTMPAAFYGTVVALTLAWRGAIPFHACMVELDGRAVLIAGRSGAGKSSLTAGLLGVGARLVADDLSVVRVENGIVTAYRGRPTMRQHRDTAARVDADLCLPITDDPFDKWLVRPRGRSAAATLPLGGVLALTGDDAPVSGAAAKIALLSANLFRPRWLAAMPDAAPRRHRLLAIAAAVPVRTLPAITTFDPQDRDARIGRALARIATMLPGDPGAMPVSGT